MNRQANVDHVLASPECQRAILAGDHGTVVQLVRDAHQMHQRELGEKIGFSQSTVCRLEKGQGRINDRTVLKALADALGIPPGCFSLAGSAQVANNGHHPQEEPDVKRSEFVKGLIATVVAAGLPPSLASDADRRVGASTIRECREALDHLYTADIQQGSSNLYAVSTYLVERLRYLLDRGSYSVTTGEDLRRVTAAATENVGWVCFDGGRNDLARRWWLEAVHAAELAQDAETKSVVLLSMSLAEASTGSGREAVHLVEAARSVIGSASPRLESLLSAREALGHGRSRDKGAARQAIAVSRSLIERGPSDADPGWISFWNAADLASHEAKALRLAGDHAGAERAGRRAVALADPMAPRNVAFYNCQLAGTLAAHGDLDEAIALARPMVLGGGTDSRRVQSLLDSTVTAIGHRGPQRGKDFARWAEAIAS